MQRVMFSFRFFMVGLPLATIGCYGVDLESGRDGGALDARLFDGSSPSNGRADGGATPVADAPGAGGGPDEALTSDTLVAPPDVIAAPDLVAAPPQVTPYTFEGSPVPAWLDPGLGVLAPSEGFGPLGFGTTLLRSPTTSAVTIAFKDLPPHTSLSLQVLFAAIDSLDGSKTIADSYSGDYFNITLDGRPVFRASFANAQASPQQSYIPPAGVQLARNAQLGFQKVEICTDSAYNLGLDPSLQNIPHIGPTVTVRFFFDGPGLQNLEDESWGLDNLGITVSDNPIYRDAGTPPR